MAAYRHRQFGTLVVVALGLGLALTLSVGALLLGTTASLPASLVVVTVSLVLLGALWLFHSLEVAVGEREVRVAFGPGLVRRRIPLARIQSARAVRNPWYYGWGVRWIGRGWMFNVSGLDAVELALEGGRRFRIGTDDPQGLAAAVEAARPRAS